MKTKTVKMFALTMLIFIATCLFSITASGGITLPPLAKNTDGLELIRIEAKTQQTKALRLNLPLTMKRLTRMQVLHMPTPYLKT